MASLEKLLIRGIRSFDDKQASVIEFYTPVTVIVGHNGSGKTTIIECLKYATTGDQPPNTKGGAFIHDPKIANEKEVKAQVKLRFVSANAVQMLAVRNLSVTVKKGGLTMKTLENLLAKYPYKPGDKRAVLSTKCAELDAEIPNLLGVSKAVLENVIFCHQEDSYWPLAEASVLKKKFDDIFEATKYTKALDAIKNLRKERVAELKTEKERLSHLQLEKTRATKLRAKITELNQQLSRMEADQEELGTEIERVEKENIVYYDAATQYRQTYVVVEQLEKRIEQLNGDIADQLSSTQELINETDEEIEAKVRGHQGREAALDRESAKAQAMLDEDSGRLAEERKNLVATSTLQGTLQAEAMNHERNIRDRETLIQTIADKHGIKGYDHSPLEDDRVLDFELKLKDIARKHNSDLEKLQNAGGAKAATLEKKERELSAKLNRQIIERDSTREQIRKLQTSIAADEKRVDNDSMVQTQLKFNEEELKSTEDRLEAAKAAFIAAKHDDGIAARTLEIKRLHETKDTLHARMMTLTLQADSRAKLALTKADLSKKRAEIDFILDSNNQKLLALTGVEARAATMEEDVDRAVRERETRVSQFDEVASQANRSLHQIENSISTLNQQLKTKKTQLKDLTVELNPALDTGDGETFATIADAIKSAQKETDLAKEELSTLSTSRQFFKTYLDQGLKNGKVCKMCDHKMSEKEWDDFEKKMAKRLEKSASAALETLKQDIEYNEDRVRSLQSFLPKESTRNQLKEKDIPNLEQQLADQDSKLGMASQAAEQANENLKKIKGELRDLQVLKSHASVITRTQKDIERLQKDIKELETTLSSSGSTETTDDLQSKIDDIEPKLVAAERARSTIQILKDSEMGHQRAMEKEVYDLRFKSGELKSKLKDRENLQASIANLKHEIAGLQTRVKELDVLVQNEEEPIQKVRGEIEEHSRRHGNEIKNASSFLTELHRSLETLENQNAVIERYVKERRARELKKCNDRVQELEQSITELSDVVRERRDAIAVIEKEKNEGGATLARYKENLRLRKLRADLASTREEREKYNMEEASKARRNFERTYPKMQEKLENLKDKRARLGGEISTERAHLEAYERDLSTDFKDIDKRYTGQLVQVKISDMANNDLEKYAKALDNAIMKYHSLKMEEVNETMRHLWNKTYQGTDIDGIRIRSDNDGASTTRRTYNYRVVMTKDQVEMDMRGRCSAGQKMLASIIIRLALSDSFGQNCGILALDEPTNALDSENIDALAESLVDIIKERRAMSNFQLIVITHDERFLDKLGQADVMEYYWRVMRDRGQKSIIERHRFGDTGRS